MLIGLTSVLIASLFWGIKSYNFYDGLHFQFLQALGILFVAFTLILFSGSLTVHYPALFVGALWSIGNVLTVPIITSLGLSTGFSLWSGTNLLLTFCYGTIGPFGLPREELTYPILGFLGITLGLGSLYLFCTIETTTDKIDEDLEEPLLDEPAPEKKQKTRAIGYCLLAGFFYSLQFLPAKLSLPKSSDTLLSDTLQFYASQFLGIFITSTIIHIMGTTRNIHTTSGRPYTLSIISGIIWAIGSLGGILGSQYLGLSLGVPLSSNGAFIVNNLWSYFYFGEIPSATKHTFSTAIFLTLLSSLLLALSKS
eukprot:snap_masked-scaffold_71-processed-gene-0.34-mRNA-1 protein AED:1.00 eAED:1.00 QI:0/0/0/0/1/1/2/0/309